MDRDSGTLLAAVPTQPDGNRAAPVLAEDISPVTASAVTLSVPRAAERELVRRIPKFPFFNSANGRFQIRARIHVLLQVSHPHARGTCPLVRFSVLARFIFR
jgi:hypothetical protein